MEKRFRAKGWPLALVLLISLVLAAGCGADGLTVKDIRAREGTENPGEGATSAVFFTIQNAGDQDDALIGATTDVADRAELHEAAPAKDSKGNGKMDGMSQGMQQVEAVPLPAGKSVELRPGGLHVMLFDIQRELVAGDRFQLTLEFEKSAAQTVEVDVVSEP